MKPSNELFALIKSLTKSEKRFFKLQSTLQSGDKNYVRIFDVIEKMQDYDEELLKESFKTEKFIRHLPSEKNHLYKQIMRSLRLFSSEANVSSLLKTEIKNIEILYNKALYSECNKFLERAKKIASKYEKFYHLYELINWEKTLLEESYEDGLFNNLDQLINEEKEVLDRLRNLAEYHVLYSKINFVFRSGGYARTEENMRIINDIVNHPLIKGKNTAMSKRAATICFYTQGFCKMANGDATTALQKFIRVKEILDNEPHLRSDLSKRYIRTLSNIITCCMDLNKYTEAREYITLMRSFDQEQEGFDSPDVQTIIFKNAGLAELEMCHHTGDFEKALRDVEEISASMLVYADKLNKEHELTFYFQFAFVQFGAGNFNKALFWLNKILNDNETELRQDLFSYARLFNFVIHFELGNEELLEYTLKSTARYLQKQERDFPFEKIILDNMKKLIRIKNKSERKMAFESFRTELAKSMHGPEDKVVLRYFDFIKWLDSKVDNSSFAQAVQEMV